jgi:hypothetical protein
MTSSRSADATASEIFVKSTSATAALLSWTAVEQNLVIPFLALPG